jgi:undecaprenyl diphosphate synthase
MHLGFIMDGNRRWAKSHAFATLIGHAKGADVMESVIERCIENGVEVASFWALAKKNIEERSEEERSYLYRLLLERVGNLLPKLREKNVAFRWVGNRSIVPENVRASLESAEKETAKHSGMLLVIAVGYGGQDEIVSAVKAALHAGIDPQTLNEKTLLRYLDTGNLPPPDLIVRTGGDTRHSGYFLFQSEYSEYYFTKTLWPDFSNEEFDAALGSLKGAKRNFGK